MFGFAFLLRCVLIVALCLDGSAAAWRASVQVAEMAGRAVSTTQRGDPEELASTPADDCEQDGASTSRSDSSHPPDCDCSEAGCSCACAFAGVVFAHTVPFAAQHALAAKPMIGLKTQVVRGFSNTVFRPPIG